MHGLLASLRLPFVFRGLSIGAVAATASAAPIRTPAAVIAAVAANPLGAGMRPAPLPHGYLDAPADDFVVEPSIAPPRKAPPVEPSVRVAAAHLVDPVGQRVVPFRPVTRWPLRRAAPRIYDPFRGFPRRSAHLADLMDARARKR